MRIRGSVPAHEAQQTPSDGVRLENVTGFVDDNGDFVFDAEVPDNHPLAKALRHEPQSYSIGRPQDD